MKRVLVLAAALVIGLGMASASFAATANIVLTVTITNGTLGIGNNGNATIGFGSIIVSSVDAARSHRTTKDQIGNDGRGIFKNTGNTAAVWLLSATNLASGNLDTTGRYGQLPQATMVRLSGVWSQWDRAQVPADYSTDDVITTVPQVSGLTQFGVDAEADMNMKATNVPGSTTTLDLLGNGGERSINFALDGPATIAGASVTDQTTVTVTAQLF